MSLQSLILYSDLKLILCAYKYSLIVVFPTEFMHPQDFVLPDFKSEHRISLIEPHKLH